MRDSQTREIIATATMASYRIPTGTRAWIEDVIIDSDYRSKGLGRHLLHHLHTHAESMGLMSINLTSSPSRVPANMLYQSLGYDLRETNVYRYTLTS